MRKHISFFTIATIVVFFFSVSAVKSQTTDSAAVKVEQGTIDELPAKPFRLPALAEINGSPFLTADYQQGAVELGQGKVVTGVPVKFNIFNNAVMVLKNGEELKLEFFELVSYDQADNSGNIKHVMFKAGYPEVDGHDDNSVYQVLSLGPKVHLLKFMSQKVEDAATLGDYSRKEIITTAQLYIYTPGGKIKKIKNSKQALQDALPELAAKIDEVATAKKLKLKSESEISVLVEELNKP
ncbi:MAG: hypothetical protein JNJ86_08965 [Chitinophagaceae bacterium]|jgi:hypothetical protein|nr:hypothetical protein [Chitinophagaceae bacterium]